MYVRPFTLFSTVHPALLLFYALGAPVLAMFGNNPVTMGVMFLCAVSVHWFYLGGWIERNFICSVFCFCVKYAVKSNGGYRAI